MTVPVMNVWVMWVTVCNDDMPVEMAVLATATATPGNPMYMLVMLIVTVRMFMLRFVMDMFMRMVFG
jgi:hypothetical protein